MTRQVKTLLLAFVLILCSIFSSCVTAEAKYKVMGGNSTYTIPATSIKSISKRNGKIIVKLNGTINQEIYDEVSGHVTTKKLPKTLLFKTNNNTNYVVKYHLTGNTAESSYKKIKKMLKKVKKNISDYEYDESHDNDFQQPILGFVVENDIVSMVHYTEGALEAIE